MSEHTEQPGAQTDAVPNGTTLEDVIEAVARGTARAWAAPDDVSGYSFGAVPSLSFGVGFVVPCPTPPPPSGPRGPVADQLSKEG
jgi:hypothetical protein